mgnify:CR=1 FL=1
MLVRFDSNPFASFCSILATERQKVANETRPDVYAASASASASSTQVHKPSRAARSSSSDGNVGAMRMFASAGSSRYGYVDPAGVTAIPAALAASVLSGCLNLTPPATAEQAHGVALAAESSARVQVNGPRFQMNDGELELAGTISKKPGASTAAFSHLDILFCNGSGAVIATKPISFFPRMVGESRFSSQLGYYSLKLDPLPDGTARIAVRAHDADIKAPHG